MNGWPIEMDESYEPQNHSGGASPKSALRLRAGVLGGIETAFSLRLPTAAKTETDIGNEGGRQLNNGLGEAEGGGRRDTACLDS